MSSKKKPLSLYQSQNFPWAEAASSVLSGPLPPALYLVATPIGNVTDITMRALAILQAANVIACEDSRIAGKLLSLYGISARFLSYHDHNADQMIPKIIETVKSGQSVALISDAGTPMISDPGYRLVRAFYEQGLDVTSLPGACAAITALTLSGLPTDTFYFGGFLPHKESARHKTLEQVKQYDATLIFYESPNRLTKALQDIRVIFGSRPVAIARELTKLYETILTGTAEDILHILGEDPIKGECVIMIGGADETEFSMDDVDDMLRILLAENSVKDAARIAADTTRLSKKELYERALLIKKT